MRHRYTNAELTFPELAAINAGLMREAVTAAAAGARLSVCVCVCLQLFRAPIIVLHSVWLKNEASRWVLLLSALLSNAGLCSLHSGQGCRWDVWAAAQA